MPRVRLLRDQDVKRIIIGPPSGRIKPKLFIETREEVLVLEDATVGNIVRGYLWVWNHPKAKAIEMVLARLTEGERKKGYGEYQHIESSRDEEELQKEIDGLLAAAAEG